jgi:flagellar M-ring protein FliF
VASIAAIIIFLISFFVYVVVQMSGNEYVVLYSDLELSDSKQIVDKLDSSGVSYRLEKNGSEILVPADEVNRLRLETVDFALGSGVSGVGYEVFDNTDALGSTNFVQNVNLLRALEGELARTISSVENIRSARVHLVMPKREIFSREEQKPSASVVIRTKEGPLNPQSIQAIQMAINAIEENASSITGVFQEMLGGIQQRDAVSNVKVGIRQSTLLTKQYFHAMDLMFKEVNYDCLNNAKLA